jgi:hypothetical protein
MSDKNLEQRINFKCCVKIGKSASETLALLTVAYGEHAMKKLNVFEWHRQLKEGRGDVEDDPGSGQPKTQRTDANVDRVQTLFALISTIGCETNSRRTEYEQGTVRQIITKDLGMGKFLQRWFLES